MKNKFDRNLKSTFQKTGKLYDLARRGYPEELIKEIIRTSPIEGNVKNILDIGCGNGLSTLPFAKKDYNVVGIDISQEMLNAAKQKLKEFKKVKLIKSSFEEIEFPKESFDIIISGQAFHWIDPKIGYKKSFDVLKENGYIAIFWKLNQYEKSPLLKQIQKLYKIYCPKYPNDLGKNREKIIERFNETNLFQKVITKNYYGKETYTKKQLLDLIQSYSWVISMDKKDKMKFLDEINKVLINCHESIKIPIKHLLVIVQKRSKPRVIVAMSGGVDSSVAAKMMLDKGYKVIGVFMKCFSDTKDPLTGECNWRAERRMATKIAAQLEIPLVTVDFEKEYKTLVINEMIKSYKRGITPNPDVDCNNKIKFPLLWQAISKNPQIKKFGKIDYIVTGHYAQIKKSKNRFELLRAKDESKDQSYFLCKLTQKDLSHTLFPIGEFTKTETRALAEKWNFPNANKKGTTGICFVGKINVKDWLKHKIPKKKGKILNPEGKIIGEHDGIYYYTIGERIGPRHGITFTKIEPNPKKVQRWYVAKKDAKKNTLTVAPEGHPLLFKKEIIVKDLHKINPQEKIPKNINVRIRHVGELLPATFDNKNKKIILKEPITGISEGQAIVFYKKNSSVCLGGGTIGFK